MEASERPRGTPKMNGVQAALRGSTGVAEGIPIAATVIKVHTLQA